MKRVILVNPNTTEVYESSKVKYSVPQYAPLNLLIIAGALKQEGHKVKLVDLDLIEKNIFETLEKEVSEFQPEIVGITFTSALYSQCMKTIEIIRKNVPNALIVAGGAHASSEPRSVLKRDIDIAIMGEGDYAINDIIKFDLKDIRGIAYKNEKKDIIINLPRPFEKDLDKTPMPDYDLVDIYTYKVPYTLRRRLPVAPLETSRGCLFGCVYCTKSVQGKTFRVKSSQRVFEEIKALKERGYREFHIVDDMFTTFPSRTKDICKLMIENKIDMKWMCSNGIRVNSVDEELLRIMKKAGCYSVSFGVESGNDKILKRIDKAATTDDARKAVKLCKKVGIQTICFFMFGLPDETEENLRETLDFAKELNPDIAKFDIMIPLPSTIIYEEWKGKYIESYNWDDYAFHKRKPVYNHPNLSWETLNKYYHQAYREFYLRPSYIFRRLVKSTLQGTIFKDIGMLMRVRF